MTTACRRVTSSAVETQPVDVTLVLDVSGSVSGAVLERLKADIQKVADSLDISDRIRLLSFDVDVSDVFGLQPGGTTLPLHRLQGGGLTSLHQALAAALMMVPDADRPQLVFAFSDGLDNASFLDLKKLSAVAEYSSATMYLAIVPPTQAAVVGFEAAGGASVYRFAAIPNRRPLSDVAVRQALVRDPSSIPSTFQKVLSDFPEATSFSRFPPACPATVARLP